MPSGSNFPCSPNIVNPAAAIYKGREREIVRTLNLAIPKMALEEEFKDYAEKAKSLPATTKDADKLILYGLYKQATVGAVNTSKSSPSSTVAYLLFKNECTCQTLDADRPGIFSLTERAKWDAWKAVEGKTTEEAMREYITKVKQLQA